MRISKNKKTYVVLLKDTLRGALPLVRRVGNRALSIENDYMDFVRYIYGYRESLYFGRVE